MNQFDKQRIENAIWILLQYKEEIKELANKEDWQPYWCSVTFDMLKDLPNLLD